MNDLGCGQHTHEWYQARLGMLTASRISAAITPRKKGNGELAARRNLKFEMLAEVVTLDPVNHFVSMAMEWGIAQEPKARAEYEVETGYTVEQVGLLLHPEITHAAASPDGLIITPSEGRGLLEIKCPETKTHMMYRANGVIPEEYRDQMDWQMACAGPEIEWGEFVSYDSRIAPEIRLFIVRRQRDNARIAEMESLALEFLEEYAELSATAIGKKSRTEVQLERSLEARKAFRKMEKSPFKDAAEAQAFYEEIVP